MSRTMAARRERIARLTSTPREMEAGIIVAALEQEGIKATTTGEATAGFRAEAPGWVQVLVAEEDIPRAEAVLSNVREDHDDIDWSQVDVGEPEHENLPETLSWWASLMLWRRIAVALIVLFLIWFALGLFSTVLEVIW